MDKEKIIADAHRFTQTSPDNYVSGEIALSEDLAGMKIFDSPIFAFGSADDELYTMYKSSDIIGAHFLSPSEWLPDAKTVISFFLPFTERIKSANAADYHWPANEWLHGRIEGQELVKELSVFIQKILSDAGYVSIAPGLTARSQMGNATVTYTSKWSERHAAFACGLGTFGLSKGLITEKGTCGRFGSVLTQWESQCDGRRYEDIYEYCVMCGSCISHCPAKAISFEEGKKHPACSDYINKVLEKHSPRYGCGKCQVNVPCEGGIPVK